MGLGFTEGIERGRGGGGMHECGREEGERPDFFFAWEGSMARRKLQVVDVWASNEEEELSLLRAFSRDFPIVAMATSLDLRAPPFPPRTLDGTYEAVRAAVDGVPSAQVGLALLNLDGELAPGTGGRVWRFHLGGAEGEADPYRVCGALRAPSCIWVTWDGAHDMAYLVRHLNGGALPDSRDRFLHLCNVLFPQLYDLKVLTEWTTVGAMEPPAAGTSGAAAFERFLWLARKLDFTELMVGYNAFLSGLGAADERELVWYKREEAKHMASLNRTKEMLRKNGRSDEYIREMGLT